MKLIYFIGCLFFLSCTNQTIKQQTLGYSLMPSYLDIDSIQPFVLDDTNRVVDSTYEDFSSIPLDGGYYIGRDTIILPPGILISDRKAALYTFYKSSWERQRKELKYSKYLMSEYYNKALSAEALYQDKIYKLELETRRSWYEKNKEYIGFLFGAAVIILTFSTID